jgi:hypothetical protein
MWKMVKELDNIYYSECKHCKSRMAKGDGDVEELDFAFLKFEN